MARRTLRVTKETLDRVAAGSSLLASDNLTIRAGDEVLIKCGSDWIHETVAETLEVLGCSQNLNVIRLSGRAALNAELNKIHEAMSLLNSMVRSGENHTPASQRVLAEARKALESMRVEVRIDASVDADVDDKDEEISRLRAENASLTSILDEIKILAERNLKKKSGGGGILATG